MTSVFEQLPKAEPMASVGEVPKKKPRRREPGPAEGKTVYMLPTFYGYRRKEPIQISAWTITKDAPDYIEVRSIDNKCPAWKQWQRFKKTDTYARLFESRKAALEFLVRSASAEVETATDSIAKSRANKEDAIAYRNKLLQMLKAAK